jgi:hypothetical protein
MIVEFQRQMFLCVTARVLLRCIVALDNFFDRALWTVGEDGTATKSWDCGAQRVTGATHQKKEWH